MTEPLNSLAAVYSALAEVLVSRRQDDLPLWIAASGDAWPIFGDVANLGEVVQSDEFIRMEKALAKIPAASLQARWAVFESAVMGSNSSPVWLHESMYLDGRIPGPTTFRVKSLYELVGLEVIGAELSDHISLELEFIAFMIRQECQDQDNADYWNTARRLFIEQHAKKWIPQVGWCFAKLSDPAWRVIGQLLTAILSAKASRFDPQTGLFPNIENVEICSLCGFCTQVCPTKALLIIENETSTMLTIKNDACIGCSKCERICPEHVLAMVGNHRDHQEVILIESPRVICKECGHPMFSQAEFNYTVARLSNLDWLSVCFSCRTRSVTTLPHNET